MKRLTNKRCNGIKEGYWSQAKKEELVQRLAAYEDTGLEPEEIQQYRAIGTVGDCKNAMQKQQIVKPEFLHMLNDTRYKAKCKCGRVITADIDFRDNPKFCSECGAEFDWSAEE